MRRIYLIGSVVAGLLGLTKVSNAQVTTQTLSYTGALQTLNLPACVSQVTITAYGAQGVNGANTSTGAIGGTAGLGAQISGVYTFTSAVSVLNVYVGGAGTGSVGGFNGGGNGAASTNAGAGGGASDVRIGGTALTDRIIVAGGGGGGGNAGCASSTITGGNGGAGGGGNGTAGLNSQAGGGGQGANGSSGGAAGIGCPLAMGTVGINGASGVGGNAGPGPAICGAFVSGGGGGGGFVGGGGGGGGSAGTTSCTLNDQGAGGGGAGGTNFFASAFSGTTVSNGVRTGNGLIVISYSVSATPTITAASPTICSGKTATLTASGATTYTWSNAVTGSVNPVAPTSNTTYTVVGSSFAGCTAQAVVNVTVNATPTISFTASSPSVCSNSTLVLTGTGGNTYAWSNSISNGVPFVPSSTICPSSSLQYTVTGTSALGCSNTAVAIITVVISPSVAPTTSTPQICAGGGTIIATAPSCATGYTWMPGSITTNTLAFSSNTTTTYTLTSVNGACSFSNAITLTVNALPGIFAIATPSIICANKTSTLQGGGAATYSWMSTSPTLTGSTVFVNPSGPITYTVLGNNGTCTNTTTFSLQVNPNPTITSIAVANSSVLCLNQSATLTANTSTVSPVTGYTWTAPGVTSVNLAGLVITPTATAAYPLVVQNSFSCTSTATQVIVVNPLPTVTAVASKTLVCAGQSSTLTAGGANTYSWSTGAGTATTVVSLPITTTYTVTGTFTATGCKNTKTVTVSVFTPSVTVTGPTATCKGGTVVLTGNGASTYTWNGNYPFQNFSASPSVATVYLVTGATTSNNVLCSNTASVLVTIYPNPTISAVSQPSAICRGETTALTATGASTYLWSDNQSGTTVSVSPQSQSVYTVIGTDANGCKDTTYVIVKVSYCTGLNQVGANVDVFNVFPNPNNGEFIIQSDSEADLSLVNEVGQLVRKIKLSASNTNKISIANLASGIYYLVGERDGNQVRQKIIVNK